ncbi:putative tetratricopeptide-like helical domain superfamily [Plasmopara halstedii]
MGGKVTTAACLARKVYERALEELRSDEKTEQIYLTFALFEERCREVERARAIFKYALDTLPKEKHENFIVHLLRLRKNMVTRRIEEW